MNIFLIVIGAIILFICGLLCLASGIAIKNQTNWDDFYKQIKEKILDIPEEAVYNLVCRMNFWSAVGVLLGFALVIGGIILTAL
jgi:hypothetical protein